MASGWSNKGLANMLAQRFRGVALPTNFYVALFTSAVAPNPDTNTKVELTEIANGNGYTTGGIQLAKNSTDFDVLTEDDANDRALVQIKNLVWSAVGGPIPASGAGARFAALTDDNVTQGSRTIEAHWDLAADRTVSDGQDLILQDCELRLSHPV